MESVVALFKDSDQAARALHHLQERGFRRDNLGFAIADPVAEDELASETGVSPEQGAPAGAGAVLRGIGLGIAASMALTLPIWALLAIIPDTRIYSHGGFLITMFGVVAGGGLGGIFGSLTGADHGDYVKLLRQFGVPSAEAENYQSAIAGGNVMVIARSNEQGHVNEAANVLRGSGAIDLEKARGGGELTSQRNVKASH